MAYSKLSSKGQITIPKELRDELGLQAGDRLQITEEEGQIKISKVQPFDEAYHKSTEGTLNEWMSDEDEQAYGDL
ncbi:MAG: AbrB/MazE/SpoVT family DNA-binding domain-containing protein [bacterium]